MQILKERTTATSVRAEALDDYVKNTVACGVSFT